MSVANAINNRGQVVGTSCADPFFDNCRAFLWQDGVMTDLNTLIPTSSSLSLVIANDITDRGEIVGFAIDQNTGDYRDSWRFRVTNSMPQFKAAGRARSLRHPSEAKDRESYFPTIFEKLSPRIHFCGF